MRSKLTHIDDDGHARMVDVSHKKETQRRAVARGEVVMKSNTLEAIVSGNMKKGDVFSVAQLAGIMAAKRTSELIPLCHPLSISHVEVNLDPDYSIPGIKIQASVETTGRTGVEMEALTAVTVTALTIYDMVKAVEKTMKLTNIRLVEKHGGMSGDVHNE